MKLVLSIMLSLAMLSACGTGYQKRGEYPSYYEGGSWECHKIEGSAWGYRSAPGCETYRPPYQR